MGSRGLISRVIAWNISALSRAFLCYPNFNLASDLSYLDPTSMQSKRLLLASELPCKTRDTQKAPLKKRAALDNFFCGRESRHPSYAGACP